MKRGFSLIEMVVGIALIAVVLFALQQVSLFIRDHAAESSRVLRASLLLDEGGEAIRSVRDQTWSNISSLTAGSTYYLSFSNGAWETSSSEEAIGEFYRSFVMSDVERDATDDITDSGVDDPDTKRFDISVSWLSSNKATSTASSTIYLTNYYAE